MEGLIFGILRYFISPKNSLAIYPNPLTPRLLDTVFLHATLEYLIMIFPLLNFSGASQKTSLFQ